jgi:hypothetical protein
MSNGDKYRTRRMPYPPSFRRIPAKIIDPATGASTWAFGSQRWEIYRGIFTRKARHIKRLAANIIIESAKFPGKPKNWLPETEKKTEIDSRRGSEAETV